ncbi:grb10 interacting gyf protein [Holotrichia oblita]|uniref:Grb10 interacting gyf protein n=1 Tax=Holotrichia oblita TaxID=644536 RepID=A0ACB9T8P6_HOLOL|nr:grb10 interacting gyf protein [Holotrichia oblita]
MTDSMNFGPEWLRNLSSDGSTTGGTGGGARYQLSGYRYGREEMLGLYEKGFKPPNSLFSFTTLYSEQPLVPLVLTQTTEEERSWSNRTPIMNNTIRGGRGASLERGGRISRGRGSYQSYGRNVSSYESGGGWGNGEQSDWSPRKDYAYRSSSVDNWRRNRSEEEEDWRSNNQNRGPEKWGRSTSWRDGDKMEDRGTGGPQERPRNWHENSRGHGSQRRGWDNEDLPEWATEHLGEGGGTFDSSGAYHGSDEEKEQKRLTPNKKDTLQKSSSQQNISAKQPPLTTSKSAISLSKQKEIDRPDEEMRDSSPSPPLSKVSHQDAKDIKKQDPPEKQKSEADKSGIPATKEAKTNSKLTERKETEDGPLNVELTNSTISNNSNSHNGLVSNPTGSTHRVEEDFDRLQEDLVSKLVVEEESPKGPQLNSNMNMPSVGTATQPPPNLVPPIHDQWYYQDPQGDLQGPFVSTEMAEWFKAGYFSNSLRVRRQCDNSFYTLGDLVRICNGNPFLTTVRIPPLKETAKIPEQDLLNLHLLQTQLALRHVSPRGYKPDWAGLSALQQRDLLSQHMLTPQISPVDLQYLQQTAAPPPATTNPLMHIINQMQQVNKLPGQPPLPDQPPNSMPVQMDPLQALVQQMHSLQRIQPPVSGIPGIGLPPNIQNENLVNNLSGMHGPIAGAGMAAPNLSGLSNNLSAPGVIPTPLPPKPPTLESLANANDNDPINSLLRQLQSKQLQQTPQIDTLWQQNQFVQAQTNNQWQQPPPPNQPPPPPQQPPTAVTSTSQPISATPDLPLSMWDIQQSVAAKAAVVQTTPVEAPHQLTPPLEDQEEKESPQIQHEQQVVTPSKEKEVSSKEEKKKKENEEKQAKKEAEEKRKQEQRRLDQEKKAAEEKRKKEEEKRKKEEEKLKKMLEKAKKEAEEKRLRELEEKRRLKELKKSEEEAKRKMEELKKLEFEQQERERREQQKQAEIIAKQTQDAAKVSKAAPWSQSNVSSGPSLADIQKAEREKRAEQVYLQQQRALQQQNLEHQTIEKVSSMQLSWASKPIQPRQVKSLAEIQAEEQERLAKQVAESRLAQQQKEKETGTTITAGIWHGQNLTWANNPSTQWSSAAAGFWDDSTSHHISVHKPSSVTKSNSTSAMTAAVIKQQSKQTKAKPKKKKACPIKPAMGQQLKSLLHVPTFVGFLRDIESAVDVKEYCREYLGDNPATHHFAAQFLEKRRSFRPKAVAHKDDMCSPAPAITPNSQHNSDFQEVKGKGKKTKKSKMTKVDASRILGFSVTAAQDRINVGDRDYGENS